MAKKKRYSDEVKEKAKEMRKAGKTLEEISEAIGATPQSIMGWTGTKGKRTKNSGGGSDLGKSLDKAINILKEVRKELDRGAKQQAQLAQVLGILKK